jgi:capsular exopolysaccharide synthesis family protein
VDLRAFFHLLRDHWKLIVLVTVLAAGGSAVLTARTTPLYSSGVTFFVAAQTKTANDPAGAYEGSLLSQQEVQSYADLLTGPLLARYVLGELGLPMSPAELSAEISSRPIPQTVLVTATVTDPSARRAQLIADAVGREFVKVVAVLERPPGGGPPTIHVTVVAPAELSTSPVSPKPAKNIGVALGLGLLLGIGLAAARRSLDTTIKSVTQLAESTNGKPVIGAVPFDSHARKYPLVEPGMPVGRRVEAFRKIGTNLQFIDVDLPHKVLLITSALPEEGKSSTVCNLAITLARSARRVLVIEADLRRPRTSGYLGLPNGAGLTSVLVGTVEVEDALQDWGDGLFTILTSGPTAPNPSDLLGSRRMGDLIDRLRGEYDLLLVDTPPILPFADTLAAAPACDGAILLARYGRTRVDQVRRAVTAMDTVGIPVLGSILSMTPAGRRDPDYGYGYRRYRAEGDYPVPGRGLPADAAAPAQPSPAVLP